MLKHPHHTPSKATLTNQGQRSPTLQCFIFSIVPAQCVGIVYQYTHVQTTLQVETIDILNPHAASLPLAIGTFLLSVSHPVDADILRGTKSKFKKPFDSLIAEPCHLVTLRQLIQFLPLFGLWTTTQAIQLACRDLHQFEKQLVHRL